MKQAIMITTANVTSRTEVTAMYFSEINAQKTMSQEQIDEAAALYQLTGSESALQSIINANLKLCVSFAKQRQNLGLSLDDLIQEANIGLIEAAKNYDPTRGVKFSSCAAQYIRKYLNEAISDKGRMVRLPQNLTRKGCTTFAESMDAPLKGDDENKTYGETFASESKADCNTESSDLSLKVKYLLSKLGTDKKGIQKQEIMCLLFGIGCREHSQFEVSRKFGMCEERVRQIKLECLKLMKELA